MKRFGLLTIAVLAAATLVLSSPSDAKRLGGGSSSGAQRQSIAPKPSTPPGAASQPVMPGATLPAKPAMPAAAPAASGMSRWLGPIAGIAAGLGLAALLSHFGLPEGMGSFLLLALVGIAIVFAVKMLLSRRSAGNASTDRPLQYAGAGNAASAAPAPEASKFDPPAWGGANRVEPVLAPADAPPKAAVPAGFDVAGFEKQAKLQFARMQSAYDAADRRALAELTTPEMFAEVTRELAARGDHQPTEIVTLTAELLEVTTEGGSHWASVRYAGAVREDGEPLAKPIDEVWNLTKPVDGSSGWVLAGIQQYA